MHVIALRYEPFAAASRLIALLFDFFFCGYPQLASQALQTYFVTFRAHDTARSRRASARSPELSRRSSCFAKVSPGTYEVSQNVQLISCHFAVFPQRSEVDVALGLKVSDESGESSRGVASA